MRKSKPIYLCILIAFLIFSFTGCTRETTIRDLFGTGAVNKLIQKQQIRYCGPDGKENWEIDTKDAYVIRSNFDKLCGKSEIKFKQTGDTKYSPTTLSKVEIYKTIVHFKGLDSEVKKDDIPSRPYVVIGTLEFPKRWYYSSTIDKYLLDIMSQVGAHAVLEYIVYQDAVMYRKYEPTNEMINVFHMYMDATLIRYSD